MGIPIYMRIEQYIKNKISSGQWEADTLIPTEAELSTLFGCSRITVTTALRELVKDGLIYRIQGKGTYVSPQAGSVGLYERSGLAQFAVSMEDMSIPGEHKCVGVNVAPPLEDIAKYLHLGDDQNAITIERIKYVDGTPFAFERIHYPEPSFHLIVDKHLEDRHFTEIAEVCDVIPGKSYVSSEPVICDEFVALMLGIAPGSPILQFSIEIHDINGMPAAFEQVYTSGKQRRVLLVK